MASIVSVDEDTVLTIGKAPIKIVGDLRKKSKWRGAWLLRRFELHEDNTIHYFHPLSGKLLGKVDLSVGVVRCLHSGNGCELQIRDAKNKIFLLRAPSVATRDTWCHYVNRTLTGSSGKPVATAVGGKVCFGRTSTATDVEVEMDVDVVVPASFDPTTAQGGSLVLKLADGRSLTMAVPEGTTRGQVLRARVNTLAKDNASSVSSAEVEKVDVTAPVVVCDDGLERSNVPILLPACQRPNLSWASALDFTPVRKDDVVSNGGGGVWADEMLPSEAEIAAASSTNEVDGDFKQKTKASVFSTGKYDMAMLLKLGKLESEFKEGLAELWGCEDEDELPEQLQELDFNDILGVGESAVERSTWLLLLLTGADDYREDMADRLEALVHGTIDAIQALEAAC
mmetsp:Transcript_33580/g.56486  ORF Transcript_33580/g.56486 Transcript_33580/m.56486 type:complete len:397 (+) Transcript_33580:58-1248(+)